MPASLEKRIAIFCLLLVVALPTAAQIGSDVNSEIAFRANSRRPVRPDNARRIEALLEQMTVEEKV
ncbi:MAG TPA: hypothetical protein VJL58_05975, partial [Pyrinomonadaceae bacterium]|nr:hypothetical protein [Pyrinomonadaceae bacterium]